MENRTLCAYFCAKPLRARLLIANGVGLLVVLVLFLPGTAGYRELHTRVFSVFAGELNASDGAVQASLVWGYAVCLGALPIALITLGMRGLSQYRARQAISDGEVDAELSQRLGSLPGILEARMGLAGPPAAENTLVLWAPRAEDRALFHPLDRRRRSRLANVANRLAIGKDGKVRCARLDVLVLEKRGHLLYILDGFFDLVRNELTAETWKEYRLEHSKRIEEDPNTGSVKLVMLDELPYIVNLLFTRECGRLAQIDSYPLIPFEGAASRLRQFCGVQQPAAAAPLPPEPPAAQSPAFQPAASETRRARTTN